MIRIQNIYYMLAYAFQILNEKDAEKYSAEKFEYVADLLGAILAAGTARQIKAGLHRGYIIREEECAIPKGKICFSETVRQMSFQKKTVVCSIGEYMENTVVNQILKSTMALLLKTPEVRTETKRKLRSVLRYFLKVDQTDVRHAAWNRISYTRNSRTYHMLMYICHMIQDGMVMREDDGGKIRLNEFVDDQWMCDLYERFLRAYYKTHYPQFTVRKSEISWNLDSGGDEFLPKMKTDVMLEDSDQKKALIIDAKYYAHTLSVDGRYGTSKIWSNHLYQIYTYVKNRDRNSDENVSGMLLYAGTDELNPDSDYKMDGNRIRVKTLNLDCDFQEVKKQLNGFIEDW